MKFKWCTFVHSKAGWLESLREEYIGKINHFVKCEYHPIKMKSDFGNSESQIKFTDKILSELPPGAILVVFDQRGKSLTSEQFSQSVSKMMESGKREVHWVIGGAFGLSENVLKRADYKFCLAPFVMSHQIAEAVALEQLYRAFTILKGLPYHNP